MKLDTLAFATIIIALGASASGGEKPASGPQPATVENAVKESDLTTIKLTAKAEQRLGIALKPVETKMMKRSRVFGGEVILPLGGAAGGEGSIYELFPKMTPVEMITVAGLQIDADGLVRKAELEREAAQIAFKRATDLALDNAGTEKDVDDARASLQQAEAAVTTAEAKRKLLGTPIVEALNASQLWIRVPVYIGDLARLETGASAEIGGLADRPGSPKAVATPIEVPISSTTANAATTDLYFAMNEPDDRLKPGQRVAVTLPLAESGESLTVPWSSVVTDINGGTWVYKMIAPQTYQRHRVQVHFVQGGDAAIASGPAPGSQVVTDGAAEIFGTEFGVGK